MVAQLENPSAAAPAMMSVMVFFMLDCVFVMPVWTGAGWIYSEKGEFVAEKKLDLLSRR